MNGTALKWILGVASALSVIYFAWLGNKMQDISVQLAVVIAQNAQQEKRLDQHDDRFKNQGGRIRVLEGQVNVGVLPEARKRIRNLESKAHTHTERGEGL